MENPLSWDEITKTIDEAIRDHEKSLKEKRCGFSLPRFIKNRLEQKGFLNYHKLEEEKEN